MGVEAGVGAGWDAPWAYVGVAWAHAWDAVWAWTRRGGAARGADIVQGSMVGSGISKGLSQQAL